jgi:NADH:ubiquinone oxidoreductase subunit E
MKVEICAGAKCTLYGANSILDGLYDLQENLHSYPHVPADAVLEIEAIPCRDYCKKGEHHIQPPIVFVDGVLIEEAKRSQVLEMVLNQLQDDSVQ